VFTILAARSTKRMRARSRNDKGFAADLVAPGAFETDHRAFGRVPGPATATLLALGVLGLSFARRTSERAFKVPRPA
jgi:hypothetical protein